MRAWRQAGLVVFAVWGCGNGGAAGDGGSTGATDSTTASTGSPTVSSGSTGMADATGTPEATDTADATGTPDSTTGPDVMSIPCTDPIADLYTTPPDLAAYALGDVIRCAPDYALSTEEAGAAIALAGVTTVAAQNGVDVLRVAYRTQRAGAEPALGSALVYLPSPRPVEPTPFVVWAHGTMGLADHCAPSLGNENDYMALPLAATGTPVIAPDYAGLGTAGTQGYLRGRDTAYSVLDSSQALWTLREHVTELQPRYAVIGHSQGGSAALATQGLAAEAGGEPELVSVVAIAPGLWAYTDTPSPLPWQAAPFTSTAQDGGILAAASIFYLYADAANALGPDLAGEFFHPALRDTLEQLVEEQCVLETAAALTLLSPTVDGLYAPGFSAGVASCLSGGACVEPHASFVQRLQDNFLPVDSDGAEILYLQGLLDNLATPDLAQCYVDALEQMSAPLTVCVDGTEHFGIAPLNTVLIHEWIAARFEEAEPPGCSQLPLPSCSL